MIIRVQSPEGTKRIEATPGENIQLIYKKAGDLFGTDVGTFKLYYDCTRKKELASSPRRTLKGANVHHGDMLYMHSSIASLPPVEQMEVDNDAGAKPKLSSLSSQAVASCSSSSTSLHSIASTSSSVSKVVPVTELPLDVQLAKEEGKIKGKRNEMLCRHKGNSRCIHCTDIDPWDENYLKENNIKHMSFHTYIKKLKSGVDKGKFVQLSNIQCSIKPGCTDHPPWPQGICSTCQPSALTLSRQTFRHVDAVVFENRGIVEDFLTYWRTTGHQRAGLLYGRYVAHKDAPLGIKAEVAAIYEPPQEATANHIKLLDDECKPAVDEIAGQLGLSCVGWVFTDLIPEDSSTGTVRHLRHSDTYFLSSHEVLTAAQFQLQHPNVCALAKDGVYGSKFATVIVTGDKNNQVHMEGYQVSHQCEALVSSNCLLPTLDCPQLAYVKESSAKQYVPDVFFKEKDGYGNEVTRLGRPLPVEYLLIDLPVSTPNTPSHTFSARKENSFPIENRLIEGHLQDFSRLSRYLRSVVGDEALLDALSDFHVLVFLSGMDILPLRSEMGPLLEAVRNKDAPALARFSTSDTWSTLAQLVQSAPVDDGPRTSMNGASGGGLDGPGGSVGAAPGGASGGSWTCPHCTFINSSGGGGDMCDMCHLPR